MELEIDVIIDGKKQAYNLPEQYLWELITKAQRRGWKCRITDGKTVELQTPPDGNAFFNALVAHGYRRLHQEVQS